MRATAPVTLLPATKDHWLKLFASFQHHDANTFWSTKFVCRQRECVYKRSDLTQVKPTCCLHSVGVKQSIRCMLAHNASNVTHWSDCANFIVDCHYRHHGDWLFWCCLLQHSCQIIKIYRTNIVDSHHYAINVLDTMQHSMMLGRGAHCYSTQLAHGAQHCRVIAFSTTTCKNHFAGIAPQRFGHHIAGLIECFARNPSKPVRPRRVGIQVVEKWCHGLNRLVAHGR